MSESTRTSRTLRRVRPGWRALVPLAALAWVATMLAVAAPAQADTAEQQGHRGANTFTNYHNASGMGPRVDPAAWVEVSCKVYDPTIGSASPDGYWYRLSSPPWNNQYYAVANTFMNGDPWGGPYTHNTDFSVPDCPPAGGSSGGSSGGGGGGGASSPASLDMSQGPSAPHGFYYAISAMNFPANSGVSVTCRDSADPQGFRTFTLHTDGSGNGFSQSQCYSGDGGEHWFNAGGMESNHVTWGADHHTSSSSGGTSDSGGSSSNGSSGSGSSSGSSSSSNDYRNPLDACNTMFGPATSTTSSVFGGHHTDYPRRSSLFHVCEGFGSQTMPEGRYAVNAGCTVAVAMGYAFVKNSDVINEVRNRLSTVCDAVAVASDVADKDWLGAARDAMCHYMVPVFAGVLSAAVIAGSDGAALPAGGVLAARLTAVSGLACGGVMRLMSTGHQLGIAHETNHEAAVAADVLYSGKCLRYTDVFGFSSWSAEPCS